MPDISELNGTAIDNVAEFDGLTVTASTRLLDTYPNATFAYSIRRLNSAYTGACCRVYSTGTGIGEQDFGFDSNGILDIDAIVTFVGAGNNGVVVTWYDQSQSGGTGSGTDITQDTTNGPLLVDAGSPILVNGLPAFKAGERSGFDTSWTSVSQPFTLSSVTEEDSDAYLFGNNTQLRFRNSTETVWLGTDIDGGNTVPMGHHAFFGVGNGSSSFGKVSVADIQPAGVTFTNSSALDATLIGARWPNNSTGNRSWLQEFVLWGSDQNGAGQTSGIEANINEEYLIYQPTDAPTSGLLATYTGAEAAYSVRQLSNKALIALRIRRDSDDEEANIGFDANGDLDTQAIADFCQTANGYVTRWWDQSTNGNHIDQALNTIQPKIYNGTTVITSGTTTVRPSLQFETTDAVPLANTSLDLTFASSLSQPITASIITRDIVTTTDEMCWLNPISGSAELSIASDGTPDVLRFYAGTELVSTSQKDADMMLFTVFNTTSSEMFKNNSSIVSGNAGTNSLSSLRIGGLRTGPNERFGIHGNVQEYILWGSAQSATNRNGIHTDTNSYFGIY